MATMIRSIRVIYLRSICRALEKRGLRIHDIADGASVGVVELRRLLEFGSTLESENAERLVSYYARVSGTTSFAQRYSAPQKRLTTFHAASSRSALHPA
jgi:hypothetical protein